MICKLVLALDKIEALKGEFGDDQIKVVGEADHDGYAHVVFEVNSDYDVLRVLHAGVKSGLDLGMYGLSRKPKEVSVTVA